MNRSDVSLFEGLTFKVAHGCEIDLALQLRRQVYARDWAHVPRALVVDDLDRRAHHLIAVGKGGNIAGTLRIVGPEERPFDIDRYLDLSAFVPADRKPAEIGRLCVPHDNRQVRSDAFVHIGMLKLAHSFARKTGLTDFVLTALPKLQNFYRMGFFEPVGIQFDHPTWGVVHVMRLDLTTIDERIKHTRRSMARLLFTTPLPNIIV